MLEFAHAVVKLRGWRENLDDQAGIEQRIASFIEELRFVADHNGVGIGVQCRSPTDAHVVHVCPARALAESLAKFGGQVQDDQVVAFPRAAHGEHLALIIFALELGLTLDFEVLLRCEECFRVRGHTGLSRLT